MFVYPVYFLMFAENGLTNSQIGILLASWGLTALLLEIPLGIFADVFDRKKVLMLGTGLKFLVFFVWIGFPSFWGYLLGFVIWGISGAMISGTFESFIYDELKKYGEESTYEKVIGSVSSLGNLGVAIALLLGGWLSEFGYSLVLYLSSFSCLISVIVLATIESAESVRSTGEKDLIKDFRSIIPQILRTKTLFLYIAVVVVFLGVYGAIDEFYPPFYSELGLSKTYIGVLGMVGYSFAALGGWLMTRDRIRNSYRLLVAIFASFLIYAGVYFTQSIFFIVLLFPLATLYLMTEVHLNSRIQEFFKSSVRATSLSIVNMIKELMGISITLVLGIITTNSMWNMFALAAIASLIALLFAVGLRKQLNVENDLSAEA